MGTGGVANRGVASSGRAEVGTISGMPWLLKTEPETYSWGDLVEAKAATWDGVANPVALKNMAAMKKGDVVLIYHTGKEKQVVGLAEVARAAYPDPKLADPKMLVIDIKPKTPLKRPVTLATIKGDAAFEGWDLIRLGRLSVVPTTEGQLKRIETLSQKETA